eukprot:TRINITY_DN5954_c1_g1_i1.p4 TRINITY_DN5954_c1_g1~~TRINITY_DN5954_c1_g1_i1.p4  ORF type:complete len:124 (-),score=6.29 TRINITY_DN5954_c1_g1_i1:195-566(-)
MFSWMGPGQKGICGRIFFFFLPFFFCFSLSLSLSLFVFESTRRPLRVCVRHKAATATWMPMNQNSGGTGGHAKPEGWRLDGKHIVASPPSILLPLPPAPRRRLPRRGTNAGRKKETKNTHKEE